ncbi:MAG TPA: hypothetical protein VEZ20_16520 [Allosphingosinicella sp.]|jgi:predicted Fe-S protein YdhL (DUF1289 family)|nr:hypothetical protein [Allosphingosinicella sp.]
MPLFPKISSPCPYKSDLAAVMDGDHCRMCDRQVFDLTAMSDGERLAFLAACTDEVCVSYSIPLRHAARAAMVAAAIAAPGAAAARQAPPPVPPMAVIVGGLPPAPQVRMVPVPPVVDREEDLPKLYEEPAKTPPPAPKPPPKG